MNKFVIHLIWIGLTSDYNIFDSFINFRMKESTKAEHFKYPECGKGGDHLGEVLNIVCLEPKCI